MAENLRQAVQEGLSISDLLPLSAKEKRAELVENSVKKFIAEKLLRAIENAQESSGEIALIKIRHAILGRE